jgi:transcriptional regulator with XRE-family HTH domain
MPRDGLITDRRKHPNSIVRLRGQRGWTAKELAKRASCDAFTILGLERGETVLNDQRIEVLCDVFDVTRDELLVPCVSPRNPTVKRERSRRNLEAGRGAERWAGKLNIPEHAHPLVRQLFEIMNREKTMIKELADRSGVRRAAISDWRYRRTPNLQTFEAVLNALDHELCIKRKHDDTDDTKPSDII